MGTAVYRLAGLQILSDLPLVGIQPCRNETALHHEVGSAGPLSLTVWRRLQQRSVMGSTSEDITEQRYYSTFPGLAAFWYGPATKS